MYGVPLNEGHLEELMMAHAPPPPALVRMGSRAVLAWLRLLLSEGYLSERRECGVASAVVWMSASYESGGSSAACLAAKRARLVATAPTLTPPHPHTTHYPPTHPPLPQGGDHGSQPRPHGLPQARPGRGAGLPVCGGHGRLRLPAVPGALRCCICVGSFFLRLVLLCGAASTVAVLSLGWWGCALAYALFSSTVRALS